jgi:hypothetical protein
MPTIPPKPLFEPVTVEFLMVMPLQVPDTDAVDEPM